MATSRKNPIDAGLRKSLWRAWRTWYGPPAGRPSGAWMRTEDVLEIQAVIKIISEYRFGCKAMRSSYSEEPKPTKNLVGSEKW